MKPTHDPSPSPSPPPPPPPREPSRKKQKVVPEPVSPPPSVVKKPSDKKAATQRTKTKANTAAKKSHIVSEDESDLEPPLPKSKKCSGSADDDKVQPTKRTAKGKGKALVDSDAEDDNEEPVAPKKPAKGKGKASIQADFEDNESAASKKPAARKTSKPPVAESSESSHLKGLKGMDKREEDPPTRPDPAVRSSKGRGSSQPRQGHVAEPDLEEGPKKSRSKAKGTAPPPPLDEDDPPAPTKPSRKRPATPDAEEESTPTKRAKTLPLQEVNEQSPPAARKGLMTREGKAPGKSNPPSKSRSHKMKENTPSSDCDEGPPAKQTRVCLLFTTFLRRNVC